MQIQNSMLPSIYLRVAIGSAYIWEVADRLGFLGPNGKPHVGWGDWAHFLAYAHQVMSFLPTGMVPVLAILATIGEATFGLFLIMGLFTRVAAIGSGLLSFSFACAMAISFGIDSPLGYSVFTLSAASFLLAALPGYAWSLDAWLMGRTVNKRLASGAAKVFFIAGFLLLVAPGNSALAQNKPRQKITEQYLLQQLLNEKGISNRNVQMEVVNFPPGSVSPSHRHPCPTFGYLLEGELESVFEGKHHLYRPGDAFYEKANGLHSLTRNPDPVKPAKLLVFFINEPARPNFIAIKK
ncbi:cupin domain-containing protein [Mucilaginibacter sp.]|uniref:cupin domain-containing protein n=1 Tax=Mucilaginibacter sp. TaxID=1882438 RepID=UPI002851C3B5|nr:cupin domain-containing protein [Mucilaginibacter sp.]MDR3695660.1 cupin domain-containing protein [Mucilaginibacter sp.]